MNYNIKKKTKEFEITAINLISKIENDRIILFSNSSSLSIYDNILNVINVIKKLNKNVLLINANENSFNNDITKINDNVIDINSQNIFYKTFDDKFTSVINDYKSVYDYIFIISDSINSSSYFNSLLKISDGVVLVEKINNSKKANIQYTIDNINIYNKNIYGFILI